MELTTFQHGEVRDTDDNIVQSGAYGKTSAFVNATNDGILDYVINNLEYLYNLVSGGGTLNIATLTATTITATTLTVDTLNAPEMTTAEVNTIWESV